jgi:hypothetical protein
MALRAIDEKGNIRVMTDIDYRREFDDQWSKFSVEERQRLNECIERKLDELIESDGRRWGSIMNTSIEGGQLNPHTGLPGDWTGIPYRAIWERCGRSELRAKLFFGNLWKLRIIQRREVWIGIRNTADRPTFPRKGITLMGKTYFLAHRDLLVCQ